MAYTVNTLGAFFYKDGHLYCDEVKISDLSKQVPTPFYCYSVSYIEQQLSQMQQAFAAYNIKANICYAVKANPSKSILKLMAQHNIGADTVSGYEIRKSLEAGVKPGSIVFSGIGKRSDELEYALANGIRQINVESIEELEALNNIAKQMRCKAQVALRFNPIVAAGAHDKISTASRHSKFGLDYDAITQAVAMLPSLPYIELIGLSVHIGSQITELSAFAQAFASMIDLANELEQYQLKSLDFGGGIGVPHYMQDMPKFSMLEYAKLIAEITQGKPWEIIIEPGRWLVAGSAALISKVIYTKNEFLIIDAGMNDLMRPALYDIQHRMVPILSSPDQRLYTIVGPVCESSDVFGTNVALPTMQAGDGLAILGAGAYGMSLANNYNMRPRPAEVMVRKRQHCMVRGAESYEQMQGDETVPEWL